MILLLEADNEAIHYCLRDSEQTVEQGVEPQIDRLKEKLCRFNKDHEIRMVGYRVKNGGRAIDRTVMERTPSMAAHVGSDPCLGPNSDLVIRGLMIFCWERFVGSRHFVLCDSAFYLSMPGYARSYAIPLEYTEAGLVKYGRNGMVHEWAVRRLASVNGAKAAKVITIFLNDSTDVVASRDGKPVMSSHGFSEFDGIMSRTGCGSLDTSIVFQLFAAGQSLESIDQVLSQESGFKALAGEKTGLLDLIVRDDPKAALALDIFSYQLVKTIGACAAVLEGVDSIVFIGEDRKEIQDWVYHFLREFEFLGLKRSKFRIKEDIVLMTAGSPVEAYYFGYERWPLMAQLIEKLA